MSAEKLLLFLVMLSVLVVLHEYGHFLLARRNGVRVNDFALGMGPTLLKWTSPRSGTNYRLNLLPIGGYCAMQGEDGKTTESEQRRDYLATADPAQNDNFRAFRRSRPAFDPVMTSSRSTASRCTTVWNSSIRSTRGRDGRSRSPTGATGMT
jgi:membrane-associated protease RseP (regulator of RpoE activity)